MMPLSVLLRALFGGAHLRCFPYPSVFGRKLKAISG